MVEGLHRVTHPGEAKQKEEEAKDKSQSAEKERELLERQKNGKRDSLGERIGEKMSKVLNLGKTKDWK